MNDEIQMSTRREFVRKSLLFLAAGYSAPFFLTRTVWALDKTAPATRILGIPDGRILVVIQMGGGNDGLNTVVPYAMDEYYRARPQLGLGKEKLLKLTDTVGLHENLAKLKDIYDRGQLAVVQGVGYPNPDRSHFRSMEIWQTADPESHTVTYGWLGRYLDNTCPGCDPKRNKLNPLGGVNIGGWMPPALKSERGLSIALDNPDSFRWVPLTTDSREAKQTTGTFEKLNTFVAGNLKDPQMAKLDFLSRVALDADTSSDKVRAVLAKARRNETTYPTTGLARQLQLVARLIAGGIDTRIFYVSMGGFDTHANQAPTQDRLLTELAEAVTAFQADLQKQGNAGRVLTVTFSEFGRRVAENASGGTDHGTAAPLFICGPAVRGGVYAAHPSLKPGDLDHGDLKFSTDFRQVYATILENWLGAQSAPILGGEFKKLKFV